MKAIAAIGRPEAVAPVSSPLGREPRSEQAEFATRLREARTAAQAEDGLASTARVDAGRTEAARADTARDADLRAASRRQSALQAARAPGGQTQDAVRQPADPAHGAPDRSEPGPSPEADRLAAERRTAARSAMPRAQQVETPRRDDGSTRAEPNAPDESTAAAAKTDGAGQADAPDAPPADAASDSPLPAAATAQPDTMTLAVPRSSAPPSGAVDAQEAAGNDGPTDPAAAPAPRRGPPGAQPDGKSADRVATAPDTPARSDASPTGETVSTVALAAQRPAEPAVRAGSAPASFADALAAVQHAASPAGGTPAAAPATPPTYAVHEPVGTAAFAPALSERVVALAIDGLESAQITVSPPELGPVRIELSLSGESAAVAFSALQPETRRAIEQSLPVLRDMLAEHGMRLADAHVDAGGGAFASQDRSSGSDRGASGGPGEPRRSMTGTGAGAAPAGLARTERRLSGRLDLFA